MAAGDPEKRLQIVIAPARGGSRAAPEAPLGDHERRIRIQTAPSAVEVPPPPCRPWDRADLMRRLATFKAMTWFSKPKALKIISICGWEPCVLPYVVDYEGHSSPSAKDIHPSDSSVRMHGGHQGHFTICLSSSSDEIERGMDGYRNLNESQCDPASVVLDCRLCGACVGLWAFATIPRPMEYFSLITSDFSSQSENAEIVGRIEALGTENLDSESKDSDKTNANAGCSVRTAEDRPLGLNLTIAGGPPPTKQNFKPRVSFPIISRHLRAQLDSSSRIKNSLSSHIWCTDQSVTQCSSQNDNPSQQQKDINGAHFLWSEGTGSLKRKIIEGGLEVGNHNCSGDLGNEGKTQDIFSVIRNYNARELRSLPEANGGDVESLRKSMQDGTEEPLITLREDGNGMEVGENQCIMSEGGLIITDAVGRENNSMTGSADVCHQADDVIPKKSLNHAGTSEINHHDSLKKLVQLSVNKELDVQHASGNNSRAACDRVGKFDPMRQHRISCPWIVPTDGKSTPGWKLTLSALCDQERDSSHFLHPETQSSFFDEVDDPIVSVRNLFSPSAKRVKLRK